MCYYFNIGTIVVLSISGTYYIMEAIVKFVSSLKYLVYLAHIYMHICVFFSGAYKPEPMGDMWWALLSNGIMFLYHFVFLQLLGLVR